MRTLYFDCFSGISGDMTIGALLDLGLDFEYLKSELNKLPVEGYELRSSRVVRANISALKFDVLIEGDSHDHSHSDPYGHEHDHEDHSNGHADPGHHGHFHRKASEILAMIEGSALNVNTKRIATAIFTRLAVSEGRVHHIRPEDVEFHEVGAVDSIVDTIGSAIGFDALGIERFVCSPINVGSGFIHCQHGVYPVPAPATADLLRDATIYSKHADTELVTPTGAAILAAVVDRFEPLQSFVTTKIGYGAGSKTFPDFPNCLRLMLGEEGETIGPSDEISVMEANIDDMTPQNFGYVMEKLLEAGALDVFVVPVQMKKGRPGHLIQILSPVELVDTLTRIVFQETTTIGIRRHTASRSILDREVVLMDTNYGRVRIKVSRLNGQIMNAVPEYEDCVRLAREKNVPLKEIQADAVQHFMKRS
jgi:uncharacterized protein (TIGR00299 family) protein